jgi:hypothetical protein
MWSGLMIHGKYWEYLFGVKGLLHKSRFKHSPFAYSIQFLTKDHFFFFSATYIRASMIKPYLLMSFMPRFT